MNKWSVDHPNKGVDIKVVLLLLEEHIWGSVLMTHRATLAPDIAVKVCLNSYQQNPNRRTPIARSKGK